MAQVGLPCLRKIIEAAAPLYSIDRGIPGPGLLAHGAGLQLGDHLPLNRQIEIYSCEHRSGSLDPGRRGQCCDHAAEALADQLCQFVN